MSDPIYNEDSIRSLDWVEHIRLRPGMYIGKLGDGSQADDGVYILAKEALDNSIDEFVMGHGKQIDITLTDNRLTVRDHGRGIPLGKLMDCAAKINTGAKYDSKAFKKSVGLNGVGIKAVNALSSQFDIQAYRDGETKAITFSKGIVQKEMKRPEPTTEGNGTRISFTPDTTIFGSRLKWDMETLQRMCRYYSYLNTGLTLALNGTKFKSKDGLADLLRDNLPQEALYPIIHLKGEDIEIAFTHADQAGEDYYSFVNGQNTHQGGTHLTAFREAIVKTLREHFKKDYDPSDLRTGIVAAIAIKVTEPVFESQTKTKLGSTHMEPDGQTVRAFIANFLGKELELHLHKHKDTAKALLEKIQENESERKELSGVAKIAKERARKAKIHNKKLRDCRVHLDSSAKNRDESTLFITEGNSASGSITSARDVDTQAVFSLRGKPLNTFGLNKKVVYENEEFNLLQHALNIEDSVDDLRYNKVVLATDADVDGMHIRLLMITFFLQFFPDLLRRGHLFVLQTPLFRVRNKKETIYCYTDEERQNALRKLGKTHEITRFKGLGEIGGSEFKKFIGPDIRLDPVSIDHSHSIKELLTFYMGKNTPDRQEFIIRNLRVEQDVLPLDDSPTPEAAA
ncbi:MAG: topoisomerase type subunit region 2 domain protein [Verrucomicrobiales bacterium]|nr:topoisomerase type subunit region 2 domain protein [Verrucomicrobiales bacterium]